MKTVIRKYSYLFGIIALISLAIPSVKLKNVSSYAAIGAEDGQIISYTYHSFYEILVKATLDFFKNNLSLPEVIMVLLFYLFLGVVLFQFIASLRKKYTTMFRTAIVLFASALLLLLCIVLNSDTVVFIGYYIFLIVEILLVLFSAELKTSTKDTTYEGNI